MMTENNRAIVLQQVVTGFRTRASAAEMLGICERQLRRLLRRFEAAGVEGIASRRVGKVPRNRVDDDVRAMIVGRCRGKYAGLGPTSLSQMLAERDGIVVSREWLRALMIENGLWKARGRERKVAVILDRAIIVQHAAVELVAEPFGGPTTHTAATVGAKILTVPFGRRTSDPKKVRTPAQNHPWKRPFQTQPHG